MQRTVGWWGGMLDASMDHGSWRVEGGGGRKRSRGGGAAVRGETTRASCSSGIGSCQLTGGAAGPRATQKPQPGQLPLGRECAHRAHTRTERAGRVRDRCAGGGPDETFRDRRDERAAHNPASSLACRRRPPDGRRARQRRRAARRRTARSIARAASWVRAQGLLPSRPARLRRRRPAHATAKKNNVPDDDGDDDARPAQLRAAARVAPRGGRV